jgi:uncharacterized protein DUF4136
MIGARPKRWLLLIGACMLVAGHATPRARVDVRIAFDKEFNFKPLRTWAWNPQFHGDIKMARTPADDPEAIRQRAEPIIVDAVAREMKQRGLEEVSSNPDLVVVYYLLLTTSASAQSMGQFIPSTPEWGIPPFTPATNSLQVMNQGSLVIDLSARTNIVWRGVAESQLKIDTDDKKREAVLREAIHDLLRRYPPR